MILILNSVRMGLISMIPNILPIILGLAIMYFFNIPLDIFTLLIGSIAIGIVVDDTIHFMYTFRQYYLETNDIELTLEKTFDTIGKVMVITTLALTLGFSSYIFAEMIAIKNFGILTSAIIILALLSDLLLAPALMVVAAKRDWIK